MIIYFSLLSFFSSVCDLIKHVEGNGLQPSPARSNDSPCILGLLSIYVCGLTPCPLVAIRNPLASIYTT